MPKIGVILAVDGENEFSAAMKNAMSAVQATKSEVKALTTEFAGNANSMQALTAKQEALTRHQANLKSATDSARSGLENAQKAVDKHRAAIQSLTPVLEAEKAKLAGLKSAYGEDSEATKKQAEAVDKLSTEMQENERMLQTADTAMNKWQTRVNSCTNAEKKNSQELQRNEQYLDEAKNSADHCATSIDNFGKKIKKSGENAEKAGASWKDAFKIGTAAKVMDAAGNAAQEAARKAVEAGKYVVKVGSDFESAMSNVQALSGAEGDALDKLSKKAQDLGKTTKFSATEAANAFGYMSLAGWNTQQMLSGIDGVLQLAASSGMELAQASDMVTDYLSAFNMQASEAGKMADMLAYAQAHSNTTAQQLGEAYGNCAAGLNTAGQSIDTVTALLEAMANQGTKGSEAGTALNGIMSQITQKMKDGAIQIGDTAVAVQDQEGNFRDLVDILTDVESATDGMGSAEKSAALAAVFNRTSLSGLNQILNEGVDKVRGYRDELNRASGAAEDMAGVMQDNLKGDITTMNSALEGLGIAAYGYVDGPLRGIVQGVTGMIGDITDAITPQKSMLDEFIDDIEAGNDRVRGLLDGANEAMTGAEADLAKMESYRDILLEVAGAAETNAFQRSAVSNIVGELSGEIPALAAAWDAETGALNASTDAVNKWFDAYESSMMGTALVEAQKAAWDALTEATINKAKADQAVKTAEEEITEAGANEVSVWKDGLSAVQEHNAAMYDLAETRRDALDAQIEADAQMEEAKGEYENTSEAIKALADQYGISVDELQNMGDAEEEAAGTAEELGDAEEYAAEQAAELEEAQKKVTEAAEQMRQGIEDSMKGAVSAFEEFNGGAEVTAEEVIKNLDSQIEGLTEWSANMERLGKEAGAGMSQELYDYLAEMGPESANLVQTLVSSLEAQDGSFEEISEKWGEALKLSENADVISSFTEQGKAAAEAYVNSFSEGASGASESAKVVSDTVVATLDTAKQPMTREGMEGVMAFAQGTTSGKGTATSAAADVASASASGARDYSGFYSSGAYSASGLASGIRSGRSGAVSAAVEIMRAAVNAAKSEAQIKSPSKKWEREVGLQLAKGAAKGLKSGQKEVIASANDLIAVVNKTAKKLGDKAFSADFFGVSRYTTEGSGKNKKKVKKDAQTYYGDIYDAAKSYLDKMNTLYDVSDAAELKYWQKVLKKLKKGTNAWYEAQQQINKLKESIAKAAQEKEEEQRRTLASVQSKMLKDYQVYNNMSLKAEMQYWDKARKQFKEGTQERIDADEEYFKAKQEYNEKLAEANEDYAEKEKKIAEDLKEQIEDLTKEYEDAVKDRRDSILSSMNLFEAWDAEGYTKDVLLENLRTQVDGLRLWEREIEKIRKRNLPDELVKQLEEMGPDATASIWSLNQMTSEELDAYVRMWQEKNEIAERQAEAENAELQKKTDEAIKAARKAAETQMSTLKSDYNKTIAALNTDLSSGLSSLLDKAYSIGEDAVANLIAGINSKKTEATKAASEVASAQVGGALSALKNVNGVKAAIASISGSALGYAKAFNEIHSPSKLWRREIGEPIMAGVADGIEEKGVEVGKNAQNAIRKAMDAVKGEAGAELLDGGGIRMIGELPGAQTSGQQIINIDNGSLTAQVAAMAEQIEDIKDIVSEMGVYLDGDIIAGALQPRISREMAAASIRANRGTL